MATRKKKTKNSEEKKPVDLAEKDWLFKTGNTVGTETRFKSGNTISSIYSEEYPESLMRYFLETDSKFPTIEEWAVMNGIDVRTVRNWVDDEKHPRFTAVYAQCKALQKNKLIQCGLAETYNAQIVKFLLINNHGMKEKVDAEVKGDAGLTINIREVK